MAYLRRRLRCDRVLLFAVGLVLVLVYTWSLVPRDPVHLEVRDVKEDLKRAQERDRGRDQDVDQNRDRDMDQNRDRDMDQNRDQGGDQERDQDMDQNRDQGGDQERDQGGDQGKDQGKARPPVVLTVNRTDIQTCIYVDKPEPVPTEPPTTDSPNKSKKQYPVDRFSLEQRRRGWVLLHVFGMVYMFVALAIVCDEFFVPALEVITVKLQISDDVAGATFMAAGGSAPELFTSLIGVFIARSNVGIGTIVGSAVFNILFVIGMCAIFSREMLHLTWWPLFRDVTFYILDLMMLIIFFLDNAIRWWESALLVSSYICYVTFMKFNAQIEAVVKRGCGKHKGTVQVWSAQQPDKVTEATPALPAPVPKPKSRPAPEPKPAARPGPKPELKLEVKVEVKTGVKPRPDLQFEVKPRPDPESQKPELRRTSDPQDQRRPKTRPVLQRGGSAASLHNTSMRNTIFQLMIHTLDPLTEDLSLNGDVRASQRRAKGRVKPLTEGSAAAEENNVLQDGEQKPESEPPGAEPSTSHKPDDKLPEKTTESLYETQIPEESERSSGSGSSSSSSSEDEEGDEEAEEEEEESAPLSLDWPQTCPKQASYLLLLPIVFPLWVTLPDVRNADSRRYFAMTFLGSILWIGIFSYLMVWWAHQVGETVGISEEIMGLTILAAGTSIPDLITSVIVARKGLGDMAVSSSVGSNIFDITVGLPVPWLLFSLSHGGEAVRVSSNGLFCAIVLLFLMLLFVIISIAVCRWKMSRTLGLTMFLLYFLFLLLSVLLEDRILTCPVSV